MTTAALPCLPSTLSLPSWHTWPSAAPLSTNTHRPCSSGCAAFDSLFVHGLPSSSVIEIVGGSGSGKTALCLSAVCATASMGKRVLAIDTSNGFAETRLLELISAHRNSNSSESGVAGSTTASGLSRKSSMSSILRDRHCADVLSRIVIQRARDPWASLALLAAVADGHPAASSRRVAGRGTKRTRNGVDNRPLGSGTGAEDCNYDLVVVDCLHTLLAPYVTVGGMGATAGATAGNAGAPSGSTSGNSSGGGGGSGAVNANALVTTIGLMLRRLSALGCCVIVTNVAASKHPPPHHQSQLPLFSSFPHGSLSAPLNDIFDVILTVTSSPMVLTQPQSQSSQPQPPPQPQAQPTHDTTIRIEVLLRPPYYRNQPTAVNVRVSQVCNNIKS